VECCLIPSWELLNWGATDSVSSSHFVSFQVGGCDLVSGFIAREFHLGLSETE